MYVELFRLDGLKAPIAPPPHRTPLGERRLCRVGRLLAPLVQLIRVFAHSWGGVAEGGGCLCFMRG